MLVYERLAFSYPVFPLRDDKTLAVTIPSIKPLGKKVKNSMSVDYYKL
jgi:hypothetical protein